MENITTLPQLQKCLCGLKGFFCRTPNAADYNTCPCCGKSDFLNALSDDKYTFLFDKEYENDNRSMYSYCESCKIMFMLGCTHYASESTDDVYNCHFIKKWKHKITNIEYDGMPKFENTKDWFDNANNIDVLKMYCPHNGARCRHGYHDDKYFGCLLCSDK